MTLLAPNGGSAGDRPRARAAEGASSAHQQSDLSGLGEALRARADDVLARTIAQSMAKSGKRIEGPVRESFERICRMSTEAVAQWMAGGRPEEGRSAGRDAWGVFGGLVAHREVALSEVTKRCLCWRDGASEVVRECAAELSVSPETLAKALGMLQVTLDVTLVRVCEVFEAERQSADEELAQRQRELAFMATHDPLTGLPNRTLILDRGEQSLLRARREQTPVAALLIELDNFKVINETHGHEAGDELLRAVTVRLEEALGEIDVIAHLGSGAFAVIAEGRALEAGPEQLAERVLEGLEQPFELSATPPARLSVSASIGIASGERATAEELLRDADIAMHQARREVTSRFAVFESEMKEAVQNHLETEMDLRGAIQNEEFFLLYQPTFDLRDMSATGMEALLRWKHPARGVLPPSEFIPVLEDSGLITQAGKWVLEEACRQGAAWREAGHMIGVSVNVSGRQLDTDELVGNVRDALSESGIDPGALTLEITETTLMRNVDETVARLRAVKELGVRIAIDDFGTGYSSLAHVQHFPVDALKIDRSFISRLTENPEGKILIHALVQLGKALGIETLAEGIEQHEELSLLQQEHCDSGQGFLFARPLDADAAERFLQRWARDRTRALTGKVDPLTTAP